MAIAWYKDASWQSHRLQETQPLALHPAAHVLHYASTCFEGLKAYRWSDDSVRIFRLDRHIERMRRSAGAMCLPKPDASQLDDMICSLVAACKQDIPDPPGALYIRPVLMGTTRNIGAAATAADEACLFVLVSPVTEYFSGGVRPLRILVDDEHMRSTPQLGMTKTGGNYAAALGVTLRAKDKFHVDQVLFCPDGDVQETGAANFLLLSDKEILTKQLHSSFLHGVTRDSLLTLARDHGYQVSERSFKIPEMLEWVRTGEAALSGTAAVLAPIGTLVYRGDEIAVGGGRIGKNTERLRAALVDIQCGKAEDRHGWLKRL